MPTTSEILKRRREDAAWDDHMRQMRAAEAARREGEAKRDAAKEEAAAPLLGPDGEPIAPEPSHG